MKTVVVFYEGKEVTRIRCEEINLFENGFRLFVGEIEVGRFINGYDYYLTEYELD